MDYIEEQSKSEVPQYINKPISEMQQTDISNGCYNNTAYEYDYQQTSVQQQSQYYIYQPYQDFVQVPNMAGSPLNSSIAGTPQQQQYYQAYQPMPQYIYDPQAGWSPVQQNNQQTFQQIPDNTLVKTNLSSPQQQQPASFLASYQTPPQPAHQLYIQTSNITPPTSLSPNDTPITNSSATPSTDRTSNCNSPHPNQNGIVPSHLTQTPVHSPYVMYNPDISNGVNNGVPISNNQYTNMQPHNTNMYTPLTPQNYQCNSPIPTQQFMMYNPPPMSTAPNQGSPFQTGPNSPMMHTPYSANLNPNNFNTPKFNKNNKDNNRGNRYNNGNNQNKLNFNNNNFVDQTPQSTYSLNDENMYMNQNQINTPNGVLPPNVYENNLEMSPDVSNQQQNIPLPMPMYPTSSYCDPSMGMPNAEAILNAAYSNNYENIESYGDESYLYGDDNNDGSDDNDENLACQVCRGRRMCFCYFLKVRYYKFPSFFDLVEHQYKKWRKSIAQNNQNQHLIQQQQQFMNNSACGLSMIQGNQNQSMNASMINQNSPIINNGMTSLPKKA